jgi:hypothetical protein
MMGGWDQGLVAARGGAGPTPGPWVDALPPDVVDAFGRYHTCELSTVAKDGTPITWPTTPLFQPDEGRFVVGTAIGLNRKALHVRREPRVAMLFSDPTGTDRDDLPRILVQGMARCPEDLNVSGPLVHDFWRNIERVQRVPRMTAMTMRRLDWYHIRLFLFIRPTRIVWWGADGERHELEIGEAGNVA